MFDAIIIGAGPAGLSAASILGRCCRQVLVLNTAVYRNSAAQALHGYLTRDGVGPLEFLQIARDQLARYDTVNVRQAEVVDVRSIGEGFEVILRDGIVLSCRKLLIATGVVDALPPLVGIDALYGRSVFHCPYCDAWEYRGQALAIYGQGKHGKRLAFELTAWSNDLVLCTDGPAGLDEHDLARLAKHSVPVREDRIERLDGENGRLQRIMFAGDSSMSSPVTVASSAALCSSALQSVKRPVWRSNLVVRSMTKVRWRPASMNPPIFQVCMSREMRRERYNW